MAMMGVRMDDPVGLLVNGEPVDVLPNTTLRGAAGLLTEETVGVLVVEDTSGVRGIISERDVVRALADGADPDDVRVWDVMADDLLTVPRTTTIADAALAMANNEVRHLVVVEDDEHILGIVSMRDVLGVVLTEREQDAAASPMAASS